MVRHFIKPGITGWAQASGYRGETKLLSEMDLRVQHDVYYLENWSFFFDVRIILLTTCLLLKKDEKAY
jgi:putative colanic acid biosynthesis UDP-glucose lipid carrier transferase